MNNNIWYNENFMKKFLTSLMLLTFCTSPCIYASDVIIIDSNSQARYEDTSKNEFATMTNNQESKPVTNKEVKNMPKIEVKNLDFNDKEIKKYNNEFQKYIKNISETPFMIIGTSHSKNNKYTTINLYPVIDNLENTTINDYPVIDNLEVPEIDTYKIVLQDGDYAKWNKGSEFAAEYNKDGKMIGLVEFNTKKINSNKSIVACYEYRFKGNNYTQTKLKHIMMLHVEQKNGKLINFANFIYLSNGHLRCAQINDKIYVTKNDKNIVPSLNTHEITSSTNLPNSPNEITIPDGLIYAGMGLGGLLVAPIAIAGAFAIGPFFILWAMHGVYEAGMNP